MGVVIIATLVWHVILLVAKIPINYYVSGFLLAVDLAAAYVLRDRLMYFFSQFVLPIQNPKDRAEIYSRVKNFETGERGPALFIKNGRVITHEGEADKRGPGVIVLDTASAVVLRTDTEIKDTVGPGVKFTKENEYIAGSVDLRAQWLFIGPMANNRLLLNPVPASAQKDYSENQTRRQQTSGLTRDGFEISPTVSIQFSIKRPTENKPTESGVTTQYGFDANSVRNAITREVIQLKASENSKAKMDWNKLPAHLVVNLWREYVRKFKLGDLFTSSGISGLQTIEDMINKRVKQADVAALDDTGVPTGEWVPSIEFKQLEARGLQIMNVRIHSVLFEPSIEEQIIQQWSTEWLKIAKQEEAQIREIESLTETAARDEASKKFAKIASKHFSARPAKPQRNPFKTLQLLVQPLKDFIVTESTANSNMEAELRKLDDIWKWLLDNSTDTPREQGEPKG